MVKKGRLESASRIESTEVPGRSGDPHNASKHVHKQYSTWIETLHKKGCTVRTHHQISKQPILFTIILQTPPINSWSGPDSKLTRYQHRLQHESCPRFEDDDDDDGFHGSVLDRI